MIDTKIVLKKMQRIIEEIPATMEYETDARDTWPARWVKLKCWLEMLEEKEDDS